MQSEAASSAEALSGRRNIRTIAVIIPTFRRADLLARLVDSLFSGDRLPDEVIVVDNDPAGSAAVEPGTRPVRIIHGGHGLNLPAARNEGWRSTNADLCVFMDDDNTIEPGAIASLSSACTDPNVGLAGPVILAGDEATVWCGGIWRSKWTGVTRCMHYGKTDLPIKTAWETAGMPNAFAVPRFVLQAVEGLDERFAFHNDEADLSERIARLGLQSIVVRDAAVRHYGFVGSSPALRDGLADDPGAAMVRATMTHGPLRARLMSRGRVLFHRKHSHGLQRLSTLCVFVPLWGLWAMISCFRADAPTWARLSSVRAILGGLYEGYVT
jgi:Glycosyl transferase family 2